MNETLTVGLTQQERKLLIQGLRFVRSNVMLEIVEPSPAVKQKREGQLRDIASLVDQLDGAQSASPTARV